MKSLILLAVVVLCSSCASYRHEHVNIDGSKDVTRFAAFLMMGSMSKIRTITKGEGTNYSRTASIGALEGRGDAEMVAAIAEGIAAGLAEAAKKSVGVP